MARSSSRHDWPPCSIRRARSCTPGWHMRVREINMYQDAAVEAKEALRLDRLTPHRDRKLPETVRDRLEAMIPTWEDNAAKMPVQTSLESA